MSLLVWCEIVCERCAKTATGQYTSGSVPRRSLIKDAKAEGFVFQKDKAFCSERCLERSGSGR